MSLLLTTVAFDVGWRRTEKHMVARGTELVAQCSHTSLALRRGSSRGLHCHWRVLSILHGPLLVTELVRHRLAT